jgi:WD40 repeat protein
MMFLMQFLFILGVFCWRAVKWRLSFLPKYAIFASFAVLGALILSADLSTIEALTQVLGAQTRPSAPTASLRPTETLRMLGGGTTAVSAVAWNADGKSIARANGDNTVSIWNANSGQVRLVLRPRARVVAALAWNPDGHTLAIGSMAGTIELWDTDTNRWLTTLQQPGAATLLAWNPTGSSLASGDWPDDIVLWYGWGASRSTLDHTGRIEALAWEPDGKFLASANWDKTIQLWDTDSLQPTAQSQTPTPLSTLAWSPNGTTLASASIDEKAIILWEVSGKRAVRSRTLDTQASVTDVAWNPYGTMLAAAASDQSVTLWDATNWTPLRTVGEPTRHVRGIAWSSDGKKLAINTTEALIVWDVNQ